MSNGLNLARESPIHYRRDQVEEYVIREQVDGCEMRFQNFDPSGLHVNVEGQALARWFERVALVEWSIELFESWIK